MAETDGDLVKALLEKHAAEEIAAAFVRKYRAGQSAPEDLQEAARLVPVKKRKPRADFEGGVWFSLTVGRRQNAETRWLLPMLYKAGNIAQGDLGAIRIYDRETHIEIAPASVDSFMQAIGNNGTVEKASERSDWRGHRRLPKSSSTGATTANPSIDRKVPIHARSLNGRAVRSRTKRLQVRQQQKSRKSSRALSTSRGEAAQAKERRGSKAR